MDCEEKSLSVGELLEETCQILSERHNPPRIVFPKKALSEIANDSDLHRTRIGYMGYEEVRIFSFDGGIWAIGRGEACGGYPADPYDSDILALGLEEEDRTPAERKGELREKIWLLDYFRNSLVYGMADGNVAISRRSKLGPEMLELLEPEIKKFIAQGPEYDSRYISPSTLGPLCRSPIRYHPEFSNFLADSIEKVLRNAGSSRNQ